MVIGTLKKKIDSTIESIEKYKSTTRVLVDDDESHARSTKIANNATTTD